MNTWKMFGTKGMTKEDKEQWIASQENVYKVSDWGNYVIIYYNGIVE